MTTTPPAPTITVAPDFDPCPRAEVLIHTMPADARTVTIWRSSPSGSRRIVRGANAAPVSGDFLVIDYEIPLSEPVTYTCQTTDSGGTPSLESPVSASNTVAATNAWFQDPLDPTSALEVTLSRRPGPISMTANSITTVTYGIDIATEPVIGSAYPWAAAGVRQAGSGIPFEIRTETAAAADDWMGLVAQAFPLCIRTPAAVLQMPGLMYAAIGDITPSPRTSDGVTKWAFTAQSVQPPGLGVVVPVRTWDNLADEASTWSVAAGLYATWIDAQRGL